MATVERSPGRSPSGDRPTGSPDGGTGGTEAAVERSDLPAEELDDERDKDELRQRYYGLLQEMRVVLPGVQVLVAFLLTAPFASQFDELDRLGRSAFALATVSALVAVACLLTPAVFHRVGERTRRSRRLSWGIRLSKVGVACLGVSLMAALWCVSRFVYGGAVAAAVTVPVLAVYLGLWVVLPYREGR